MQEICSTSLCILSLFHNWEKSLCSERKQENKQAIVVCQICKFWSISCDTILNSRLVILMSHDEFNQREKWKNFNCCLSFSIFWNVLIEDGEFKAKRDDYQLERWFNFGWLIWKWHWTGHILEKPDIHVCFCC